MNPILTIFKHAMNRVPAFNRTLTFLFAGFILTTNAQTAIIAHKSHSGNAVDFFIDPSSNFGDPGPMLLQVIRLNDSTYVHVMSHWQSDFIFHDTIRYSSLEGKVQDSIYTHDRNRVELINFRNSPDSLKVKTPTQLKPYYELQAEPQPETAPKKKRKQSYLLFLFGITGGGLLAFRALTRMFTRQITT